MSTGETFQTGISETRVASVKEALARLSRTGELPALPSVASSALTIARDPSADVDRLCRAIQNDVGIAARVLRVANSAIYGRRTVCKTLRDAVTTVGMRTMQDILSAAALRSVLDLDHPLAKGLWDHSLAVAISAEHVAHATGAVRRGGSFLPGLFHDVGRIVFFVCDPAAYAVMADRVAAGGDPRALEVECFGFHHAEAGAAVAVDWGLPADFCEAVRWHEEPSRARGAAGLARVVAVADHLVHSMGLAAPEGVHDEPLPDVTPLSPEQCEDLVPAIREAIESEKALFS